MSEIVKEIKDLSFSNKAQTAYIASPIKTQGAYSLVKSNNIISWICFLFGCKQKLFSFLEASKLQEGDKIYCQRCGKLVMTITNITKYA